MGPVEYTSDAEAMKYRNSLMPTDPTGGDRRRIPNVRDPSDL